MNKALRFWTLAVILLVGLNTDAADIYKVDPAHSRVGFSVRHLGINDVKGVFRKYDGTLMIDNGKLAEANGTIDAQSIDTGVEKRDAHLRSPDFFDAANYPTITFKTKRVEESGPSNLVLIADFTMRGVTKEIRLPAKLSGPVKDHTGTVRVGLEVETKLNRKDYGIKYHQVLENGVLGVGEEVKIEINAEAIKQPARAEEKK